MDQNNEKLKVIPGKHYYNKQQENFLKEIDYTISQNQQSKQRIKQNYEDKMYNQYGNYFIKHRIPEQGEQFGGSNKFKNYYLIENLKQNNYNNILNQALQGEKLQPTLVSKYERQK
ncbi:hypothetical protein PPERSA_09267 [Pseudocohnilembus persalinus]|uniref:Uncharacterized protein n=1 Tax=Pseudocohnilembus persalinus TaxID=266149 RepID=A0A0V0QM82_PSEPJ|nr:hypothetical protein PPERSA_09267 [Pseudocohnilembus persalinus]|eukprot:KRX03255.1 hypothetical protein PPERSA_09267 [Pseudocohnilembus persalinus]